MWENENNGVKTEKWKDTPYIFLAMWLSAFSSFYFLDLLFVNADAMKTVPTDRDPRQATANDLHRRFLQNPRFKNVPRKEKVIEFQESPPKRSNPSVHYTLHPDLHLCRP